MTTIKLTKKDFKYDWFNGTGKGGQNRNKTAACLRLTHIESGIRVIAQRQRDRPSNESDAMERIIPLIKSFYHPEVQKERFKAKETIRSYRESDDIVKDHASGVIGSYKDVVIDGDISEMIEARKSAKETDSE